MHSFVVFTLAFISCLVGFGIVSHAAPPPPPPVIKLPPTNCLILDFKLYDNNQAPIFVIPADYEDVEYFQTTPYNFINGAYFNVTIQNTRQTIITWSVNNGTLNTTTFPANQGLFPLVGLHNTLDYCQVENEVYVKITQLTTAGEPNRVQSCAYEYFYYFSTEVNSGICGDPQFVGLRGQKYQVHGIDGAIYSLVSAKHYSINSQFVFLTGPRLCPIMPLSGTKSASCWSHEGTYLANIGVVTSLGEKLLLESGHADIGFSKITSNGRDLKIGDSIQLSVGQLFYNSSHEATLQIGVFYIEIENIDGFVNLRRVRVNQNGLIELSQESVHGLLGQTWKNKRYSGRLPEIEGDPDDYVLEEEDIFTSKFPFSRMVSSS